MSAWDRITPRASSSQPDNYTQAALCGRKLSGMAKNLLTDKTVQAGLQEAQANGKPKTVQDGGGLTLICRPDGVGWWRFRYWLHARENRLSLGVYPETGLAQARQKRDDAAKQVAAGTDPSEHRKADKVERAQGKPRPWPMPACPDRVLSSTWRGCGLPPSTNPK